MALATAIGSVGFAMPASATDIPITFNFNNTSSLSFANGYSPSSITTYVKAVLTNSGLFDAASVASANIYVSGGVGQMGSSAYDGDGHIVGCTSSFSGCVNPGTGVTNLTLGNTENSQSNNHDASKFDTTTFAANDGYLKNCTGAGDGTPGCSGTTSPDIFFSFTGLKTKTGATVNIAKIGFDFQIYPDGTCTVADGNGSQCGGAGDPNLPDLELTSGDGGTGTSYAIWHGVTPGSVGNADQLNNPGSSLNGTFTRSDVLNPETAPQLLSTSGTICIACSGPDTQTIDFMDWPATIGIDNIVVTFSTPEPSSLGMLAFGLLGLGWIGWRRRMRGTPAAAGIQIA